MYRGVSEEGAKADYCPLLRLRKTRVEHAGSMGSNGQGVHQCGEDLKVLALPTDGKGTRWGRCSYHPPKPRSMEESMNSCLLWAFLTALKGDSEHLQRQSRLEQARSRTGEDTEIRSQGGWGHTLPTPDPQGGGFSPVIRRTWASGYTNAYYMELGDRAAM